MNQFNKRESNDLGVSQNSSGFGDGRMDGYGRANSGDANLDVGRLIDRLDSLEVLIVQLQESLCGHERTKESYSTAEIAEILGKRPYTVREWCRLERINAFKAMCGRGCETEWRVSHEELVRIQNEGLLPTPRRY